MAAEEQVVWRADSNNIYERFIEQLDEAMSGEKELTEGDQDTRYAMKLQQERLQEKNTKIRYHITPRGFMSNGQNLPRTCLLSSNPTSPPRTDAGINSF